MSLSLLLLLLLELLLVLFFELCCCCRLLVLLQSGVGCDMGDHDLHRRLVLNIMSIRVDNAAAPNTATQLLCFVVLTRREFTHPLTRIQQLQL